MMPGIQKVLNRRQLLILLSCSPLLPYQLLLSVLGAPYSSPHLIQVTSSPCSLPSPGIPSDLLDLWVTQLSTLFKFVHYEYKFVHYVHGVQDIIYIVYFFVSPNQYSVWYIIVVQLLLLLNEYSMNTRDTHVKELQTFPLQTQNHIALRLFSNFPCQLVLSS